MTLLEENQDPVVAASASARVTVLATALKLTTIYPETHPRVIASLEAFLADVSALTKACAVVVRDLSLYCDGAAVEGSSPAIAWLIERFRATGWRGIAVDPRCAMEELLLLAAQLRRNRQADPAADGQHWSTPHVQAVPMVFDGKHADGAPAAEGEPGSLWRGGADLAPPVRDALVKVASSPEFLAQLAQLDQVANAEDFSAHRDLDLLSTIASVIPAEIANSPEQIPAIVSRVLETVLADMRRLTAGNRKVRGGSLVMRAIELARNFFGSTLTAKPAAKGLPSGRPEDERIQANLASLLQEHAALPREDRSLDQLLQESLGEKLGHELLGVCFHGAAKVTSSSAGQTRLIQLLAECGKDQQDLLDTYLRGRGVDALTPDLRLRLIGWLVQAGQSELVRARGYLDEELMLGCFPRSLPVLVKVHAGSAHGLDLLRSVLQRMSVTLVAGGIEVATQGGALYAEGVLPALLAVGSEEAKAMVLAAADHDPRASRLVLADFLRRVALPEPAALVLRIYPNVESLPGQYLRNLYAAFAQQRYDATIRTATGELLREALATRTSLALADQMAIVDHMYLVPDRVTERLLAGLVRKGWLRFWDRKARQLGRQASRRLIELRQRMPR